MRGRLASASALPHASISLATARDKAQTVQPIDLAREQPNGLEVFRRRRRITGLDDVHIQPRQLPGDGEFLPASEAGSGRLLAVPQRGIEYGNFFGHRTLPQMIIADYAVISETVASVPPLARISSRARTEALAESASTASVTSVTGLPVFNRPRTA